MATSLVKTVKNGSKDSPVIFCDFDGTITQLDVTDQILTQFAHPSWREIEQEWACGSIGSQECLVRQMALVDASEEELNALIDAIPIDPGFTLFLRWLERWSFPFYVVTDGFDYVVRRVLRRAGINGRLQNGVNLFASMMKVAGRRTEISFPFLSPSCQHGCATCKREIMRRVAPGHSPIIFIGDGLSDRFAIEEADLIFAKRSLLAYCRKHGTACLPFETFDDVVAALENFVESGKPGGSRKMGEPAAAVAVRRPRGPAMAR